MIRTPPLGPRNRLAAVVLAAVADPAARRELARLSAADAAARWLGPDDGGSHDAVAERARRAVAALAPLPLIDAERDLDGALAVAGALFAAGLGFEVHELLEPHWIHATGTRREALQGLIQVAVGYQHLANGNAAGALSLLAEGATRLDGADLPGVDLTGLARAATAHAAALPSGDFALPGFPHSTR